MAMHSEDWISIAEQASVETDPAKLMTLVERLCSALDNRKQACPATSPNYSANSKKPC
jgi:hypothetical protein